MLLFLKVKKKYKMFPRKTDSITFISVSLSYLVYLGKPIQSLSLLIRHSLSLKRTRSLSLNVSFFWFMLGIWVSRFLCLGTTTSFPLNFFFFFLQNFFSFNSDFFFFKKRRKNGVISVTLTAAPNWVLTESCIDKNWKLVDWNDKTES